MRKKLYIYIYTYIIPVPRGGDIPLDRGSLFVCSLFLLLLFFFLLTVTLTKYSHPRTRNFLVGINWKKNKKNSKRATLPPSPRRKEKKITRNLEFIQSTVFPDVYEYRRRGGWGIYMYVMYITLFFFILFFNK